MKAKSKIKYPGPLAVIDIGAHSIRMEIAQPDKNGEIIVVETLSQAFPIGRDVFTKGKIGAENFILAVKILKDFSKMMTEYGISSYRAVATSAVREAVNRDIFIDKIKQETGIKLEALDSSEEIRLLYLSIKNIMGEILKSRADALVAMIGTGSSHICFVRDGRLRKAESFRMGTIRIYEELGYSVGKNTLLMDDIMDSLMDILLKSFPELPKTLIAVGAVPRSLLTMAAKDGKERFETLSKHEFFELMKIVEHSSPDKLASEYAISDLNAVGLLPCCEILSHLVNVSGAEAIFIPENNMRDAIIEDMLKRKSSSDPFDSEIFSCTEFLGEKFNYDRKHADAVSKYALEIFSSMKKIHGLKKRDRLLLRVASILHDVGQFLNNRQHHKHSYYLIKNSQIPGLSSNELELVAVIARYHRRGLPKASNVEYMQLEGEERVKVSKLAAILRVADALDRSHNSKFGTLNISFNSGRMIMAPDSKSMDISTESLALKSKSDLFIETYGIKPEFA